MEPRIVVMILASTNNGHRAGEDEMSEVQAVLAGLALFASQVPAGYPTPITDAILLGFAAVLALLSIINAIKAKATP